MAIVFNLSKGESFKISKESLENVRVDLTWSDADLDVQAWLLKDGVIINRDAFVYYNSENRTEPFDREKFGNKRRWQNETAPMSADGAVRGAIDARDGGIETLKINLTNVDPQVDEIVITATVAAAKPSPVFGSVADSKITVFNDATGEELGNFFLGADYPNEDAMSVAHFVIDDEGEWKFEALGQAFTGGLQTLVEMYA